MYGCGCRSDEVRLHLETTEHGGRFSTSREPSLGWVQSHNLLDADFTDLGRWLYNHYALFSLREDKKTVPAKYFRALLEKQIQEWCEAQGQTRCPRSVRDEIRDRLEFELLQKTLPRVRTVEVVWNLAEGWVLFHNHSDTVNDTFRKLFHRTFGLRLYPQNPLDLLEGGLADAIERTAGSVLRVRETNNG